MWWNLDVDILFAYFIPIFVNNVQNSFAICMGAVTFLSSILKVSDIEVLAFILPISEFRTRQVFLMLCLCS